MAATAILWPGRRTRRDVLRADGTLIVGSAILLFARTGLDVGWWMPWIVTLAVLFAVRNAIGRRRAMAYAAMPVVWIVAALLLWRPTIPALPSESPRSRVLVCAGDSLTAGVDIRSDADTYVARLRERLGCRVINAGRASDRVADLLKRVDKDVLSHNPDAVLVFIGGNDYMDGTPRAAFERDLDRLVSRIASARRCVVLVEVPAGIIWNPYAGVYRQVAARYGATLVPDSWLRWWFTTELLFREHLQAPMTIDGIHLSPRGAGKVAKWLEPELLRALGA